MVKISAGKLWGMRRLADAAGRWKMVAIDQRTPLMLPIAQKRGTAEAAYEDIAAVKTAVTRHLSPHASAMLVDPNFGYPRCAGSDCDYASNKIIAVRSYVDLLVLPEVPADSRPDDLLSLIHI